ncbi:MAG TPA: transcription antitermination factor NusB [Candidatus Tectomicrobia bacterium]|nr:transcription antitermination factor NusB [Candidatus Tectomicrobia bacterium]
MGTRRKARELAVQLLYQHDLAKVDPEEGMRLFWEYFPVDMEAREFCTQLVLGTLDRLAVIDELLSEASENWSLNRMSVVDRNILRLATYELVDRPEIPPSVSLNEAIEIAKKYSSPDAAVFINGVLDRVKRTVYPVGL